MRNADLFNQIADRIEKDPQCHDQKSWGAVTECGTVACVAGHAADLTGWHPTFMGDKYQFVVVADRSGAHCGGPDSRAVTGIALHALGITFEEAEWLFDSGAQITPELLRSFADGAPITRESVGLA